MRLFVATLNYAHDMPCPVVSSSGIQPKDTTIHAAVVAYNRIRNTLRFLLGNIQDFDFKAVITLY